MHIYLFSLHKKSGMKVEMLTKNGNFRVNEYKENRHPGLFLGVVNWENAFGVSDAVDPFLLPHLC